jgi:hypothetical protein
MSICVERQPARATMVHKAFDRRRDHRAIRVEPLVAWREE